MEETKNKHESRRNTVKAVAQKVACQSTMPMNARDSAWGRVEVRRRTARGNARERALYACNPPPPSQLDGRNIGHSTRRMRRAGRSSPKQFRNLARRRVFASSCDGILRYRNHVEQVEHVELSACSYTICMVNHSALQLQLETPTL